MDKTIPLTHVVARALEERRRQLDSELDPLSIVVPFVSRQGEINVFDDAETPRVQLAKAIGEFKAKARELGALDEVCHAHGITEYVESTEDER